MSIRLQFDRIPPGVEVGPHRHGVETMVYLAAGELVFVHGDGLERQTVVHAGDVLYEAAAEFHTVRNEGSIDALALLAAPDPDSGLSVDLLPSWRHSAEPVRRAGDARVEESDDVTRRLIVRPGDFGSSTFTISEVELAPGAHDDWHRHPSSEHVLVVFEGRGVIRVGALEETLEPLKGIRIEPGLPHRIENTGRTVLRYYVCATPGLDPGADREAVEAPRQRREG